MRGQIWAPIDTQAAVKAKEKDEAQRLAYDEYRRAQAIENLPADRQAAIEGQAQAYAASFQGSLWNRMLASRRVHLTLATCGDRLATFEQWCQAEQRA
jgi:hypothetical protein